MEEIQSGAEKVSPEVDETEVLTDTQDTSSLDVKEEVASGQTEGPVDYEKMYRDLEPKYKSVSGKTSKLEKQVNELAQAARLVDALNKAAIQDPDFMRMANKKLVEQGLLPESYLQELEKAPVKEESAQTGAVQKQSYAAPDPALNWARQKQAEELQSEIKFFEEFESNKPDIADGESNQIKARRSAIAAAAQLNVGRGMSKKDAYELAYIQLLHPDKLKEEGEVEGLVKARQAPTMGGGFGQAPKMTASARLTEQERKVAQAFGMTDEEYAEYKTK